MAYDQKKEKEFKRKEVELKEEGITAVARIYSYDGGPKKFKLIFKGKRREGGEFFTSNFVAFTHKGSIKKIADLIKGFEKESLGG